ncbi:MAG: PAS domain S-box protein, partial [Pelomonas sp.]|nr:PAS domain S-box protein [Roseateles sp.]
MASPRTDPAGNPQTLQDKAASTLVWILGSVGLIAVVVGCVMAALVGLAPWESQRVSIGAMLLGLAGLAEVLRRHEQRRSAMTVVLAGTLLVLVGNAAQTGLGVHTFTLAAGPLLVAVAGGVAGNGAACALALLHLVAVFVLAVLEMRGVLPGRLASMQPTLEGRVSAHLLLTVGGLASALLLNRILGAALRRAIGEEARLARLVQAANNWAWEADARFRVTHLSEEFEALSGHKREDFLRLGEPGGAVLVRDAEYQAFLQDVRAKRPYRDRINGFRAPDGRLLWTLGSGEPVFNAQGQHIGWRGVSHNITGERLALQQHQRTASMLDRVLRASPDAICVAQASTGRIRFANSGFCTLVGLPREALMGRSGHELGLWPDEREPQRLAEAVAAAGLVRDFRSAIVVNGEWRDLLVSAASLDWEGEPATMLIARDITERERDRIEAEAILDHASVGIALTRGERFGRVNRHWQEIFGGTEPQLAGAQPALPTAHEIASGALAFERDFIRADGRRITVQFNARGLPAALPGRRDDDADCATLWVAEDVTERRRQEAELKAAKQQAEGASHAKSAFLATMSHEIRTPLNGVLGLAHLMQDASIDATRRDEYLGHLVQAAEQLSGIVSDVLDLSKIEAGHLQI